MTLSFKAFSLSSKLDNWLKLCNFEPYMNFKIITFFLRPKLLSILLTVLVSNSIHAIKDCEQAVTPQGKNTHPQNSHRFNSKQKPLNTLKFNSPPIVSLSRFFGPSFHDKRSHTWTYDGQNFVTKNISHTIQANFRSDESLLANMQNFSLQKMVETKAVPQ